MVEGIMALHQQRGYLTTNELRVLRGAVHKQEVPPELMPAVQSMVTEADSGLFRAAKRRLWWRR